jgi:TonB family protein
MRSALLAVAVILILGSTGILADVSSQQSPTAAPTHNTTQLADALASLILGEKNNCSATYYPALAVRLNHQGSTVLDLSIDETGKVSKANVAASSGFAELDQAAVDCVVKEWHFTPATRGGKPVASVKQFRIIWKLTGPQNARPWLKMDPDGVCAPIFASARIRWPSYRAATLVFRVSTAGAVKLPFVAISSGDPLFDAKAAECMSKLSYTPAQLAGTVSEVSWTASVLWSPHSGLAFADGRDMGPYCADSAFPATMWKGDPPGQTDISFQTLFGVLPGNFAIEQPSGNPELDQAALACLDAKKPVLPAGLIGPMPYGQLIRFFWHEGYGFPLNMRGN